MILKRIIPLLLISCAPVEAAELRILPEQIDLQGRDAIQRLVLERVEGSESVGDLTATAEWQSSDPQIVRFDGYQALPIGNGTATITAATADGSFAQAKVVVSGMDEPTRWEFSTTRPAGPVTCRLQHGCLSRCVGRERWV